jgi:hypothetical protein
VVCGLLLFIGMCFACWVLTSISKHHMNKLLFLTLIVFVGINRLEAQDTTHTPKLSFSGYAELYYGYDFNQPTDHTRPPFVYSYNRTNEVNLDLAFVKAAYNNDNVRANFALMAGTYANANLATEPGVLKNIYEADAGVRLSKKADLWLDAGIFPSHIGFESAVGKDCWVLTRGIVSDNTPYYEAGAKITYTTPDSKWTACVLYLNGWQRIEREDGNNSPAGGLQLTWKPSANVTVNYSNYLGTQGPDSISVRRFYQDFYTIIQLTPKIGFTAGIDYGIQQKSKGLAGSNNIVAPVLIARYLFSEKWAIAGRFEYYKDKNGIFINTQTPNGFNTTGYSANIDYSPAPNAVIRLEAKTYNSMDKIFTIANGLSNTNTVITGSFAVSF